MKPFSRLQRQIFAMVTSLAFVTIALISLCIAMILYSQGVQNAESVLRNKNRFISTQILGYVEPLRTALLFASSHDVGIDHSRFNDDETRQKILGVFEILQNAIPNINYIFAGYEDGSLLINNYTPPDDFNAVNRPWYQVAIERHPDISDGLPYQEIISKEWMVSFGKTLVDSENNIIGVMSIDASMNAIVDALTTRDEQYPTIYHYVLDNEGHVLIHPDETLPDTLHHQVMSLLTETSDTSGKLHYQDGNHRRMAYFTKVETLGWIIVTEVDIRDIRRPILDIIFSTLTLVILGSLLTTWMMSFVLSRYLITPLQKLRRRVQEIVEGKDESRYIFPNNEIGMISEAIETLTEKALIVKNKELNEKNVLLKTLSHTDQLTSIANRRKMMEVLHTEIAQYKRYQLPFSALMFDIDYFKRINDTHGHEVGDQVLVQLAQVVTSTLRETDTLGRWGGEEFLLICPQTDIHNAKVIADKIFKAIQAHDFPCQLKVSISLGLSEFTDTHSLESLLIEIDKKMYKAKQAGRNRIQVH